MGVPFSCGAVAVFLCCIIVTEGYNCTNGVACKLSLSSSNNSIIINCPVDYDCTLTCSSLSSCSGNQIFCPTNATCTISGPFVNSTVHCPKWGSCNIQPSGLKPGFDDSTIMCPTTKNFSCNIIGNAYSSFQRAKILIWNDGDFYLTGKSGDFQNVKLTSQGNSTQETSGNLFVVDSSALGGNSFGNADIQCPPSGYCYFNGSLQTVTIRCTDIGTCVLSCPLSVYGTSCSNTTLLCSNSSHCSVNCSSYILGLFPTCTNMNINCDPNVRCCKCSGTNCPVVPDLPCNNSIVIAPSMSPSASSSLSPSMHSSHSTTPSAAPSPSQGLVVILSCEVEVKNGYCDHNKLIINGSIDDSFKYYIVKQQTTVQGNITLQNISLTFDFEKSDTTTLEAENGINIFGDIVIIPDPKKKISTSLNFMLLKSSGKNNNNFDIQNVDVKYDTPDCTFFEISKIQDDKSFGVLLSPHKKNDGSCGDEEDNSGVDGNTIGIIVGVVVGVIILLVIVSLIVGVVIFKVKRKNMLQSLRLNK